MAAFARSRIQVDLRLTTGRGVVRAAVVTHEGGAFLAVVTDGHIRFSRVPAVAGLVALVDLIPQRPPAKGTLVTLPTAEVDDAIIRSMEQGVADAKADRGELFVTALVQHGVVEADARLFARLSGGERHRVAEFSVTVRDDDGGRRRCLRTVRVIDAVGGRSVVHTRDDYVSAAPADGSTVVSTLTRLRNDELDRLGGNRLG